MRESLERLRSHGGETVSRIIELAPVVMISPALTLLLLGCSNSPPQVLTGTAELDAIVEAAVDGDAQDLRQFIDYTEAPCTLAEGLGGPPKCPEGEQEGTPVEVLPILGPEGGFIPEAEIDDWAGLEVSELYAAYEVSEAAFRDAHHPAGEYALVFAGAPDAGTCVTLQVRQGRIVRIDYGTSCPPEIGAEDVERYLATPRGAAP
jgi:hypothetical protein